MSPAFNWFRQDSRIGKWVGRIRINPESLVGNETFVEVGGGKLPDAKRGHVYANWPFVRLRLSPGGVRFEPTFLRNFLVFTLRTWEAPWDELDAVRVHGLRNH